MKIIYVKSCNDCPHCSDLIMFCKKLNRAVSWNEVPNDCPLDDADLAEVIYKLASVDDE